MDGATGMKRYGVTLRVGGGLAAAAAVEWTAAPEPRDDGAGWEPCLLRTDGIWVFASHDLAAAPHLRGPGAFGDLAIRYRLAPAGPWSQASAGRKEIVIRELGEGETPEAPVLPPPAVAPALLLAPTLAGTGEIGTELGLEPGLWTGEPAPALGFQWRRDGAPVPGAAARAYLVGPGDDGRALDCLVTATNATGVAVAAAGPVTARHAAPRLLAALPEEVFDQGSGPQRVETAFAFTGAALVFAADGAAIDPATGALTIPTDAPVAGAEVTVTAANSGGAVSARLVYTVEAVLPALPPETIAAGDVAFLPYWVDPARRTLVAAEVEVAGVGPGDLLEWRIDTARVNGVWRDCPPASGTRRSLGLAPRPANLPGNHPLGHFDDDEERFSIRFRKKVGSNPWSAPSPKLRLDPPGPYQPTATAATAAELRSAVLAGFASSAHYVVHVTAPITYSGSANTLHFSGLTKAGGALVIRSANRTNPPRFRGFSGDLFNFKDCHNVVLDRLNIWNDRDALGGGDAAFTVPVGGGQAIWLEDCTRVTVENCLMRRVFQGLHLRRCQHFAVFQNEVMEQGHDAFRLWVWVRDGVIEGNYIHTQQVDQAATSLSTYHPDGMQSSPIGTTGGVQRVRFRRNVVIGKSNGDYLQGMLITTGAGASEASWTNDTLVVADCEIVDTYVECSKPVGIKFSGSKRCLVERCRVAWVPSQYPTASIRLGTPAEDLVFRDVMAPGTGIVKDNDAGWSNTQINAGHGVSGWINASTNPDWPTWWPSVPAGQDRRLAHRPGPDAYRT
jgi:hypothetical protein